MKRFLLPLLASAFALIATGPVSAQPAAYPTQPIKWIVPYVAGGGTDNLARTLAEAMQPSLGSRSSSTTGRALPPTSAWA